MSLGFTIAIVLWFLAFGFIGYLIGNSKKQPILGLVLGFLLGPIGIAIILLLKSKAAPTTSGGKATLEFTHNVSPTSIKTAARTLAAPAKVAAESVAVIDPNSGMNIVNNDFQAAYDALDQYMTTNQTATVEYLTPSEFTIKTYGIDFYGSAGNSILFGNTDQSIDFIDAPTSITSDIKSDTYICFEFDLTQGGEIKFGGSNIVTTFKDLLSNFINSDLFAVIGYTSWPTDDPYLVPDNITTFAWASDTTPLSYHRPSDPNGHLPLLLGNNNSFPLPIDAVANNYTLTLNWDLANIIAHYNINAKDYYILNKDFMDRMTVTVLATAIAAQ
jgi:hypothetical protein